MEQKLYHKLINTGIL